VRREDGLEVLQAAGGIKLIKDKLGEVALLAGALIR
jgi:hypothetical protein